MHPFRAAVEARDLEAMMNQLAEDIVFLSPVAYKPVKGREAVGDLLAAVFESFENFEYTQELTDGQRVWMRFAATVGEREVDGIDLLELGQGGLIERFAVMVRPLSAVTALAERVGARLTAGAEAR